MWGMLRKVTCKRANGLVSHRVLESPFSCECKNTSCPYQLKFQLHAPEETPRGACLGEACISLYSTQIVPIWFLTSPSNHTTSKLLFHTGTLTTWRSPSEPLGSKPPLSSSTERDAPPVPHPP